MHRMISGKSTVDYNRPGTLRSLPVQVGRVEVGGLHIGAPANRLPLLMDQYIQFINSKKLTSLPPVVHALLAHFFFDTLHPFDDGNGRMSRLVAASILFQHGYNVHGGYGLSSYFYQHDIEYHTLLHRAWRRCPFDLTPFVAFGIGGLIVELKSINSFIKMKLNRIVDRETMASSARKRMGWRSRRFSTFL
jgi:Fic family protein